MILIYLYFILEVYYHFIPYDLTFVIQTVLILIMIVSIAHYVLKDSNSEREVENEQQWLLADGAVKVLIAIIFVIFFRMFWGYGVMFFYIVFLFITSGYSPYAALFLRTIPSMIVFIILLLLLIIPPKKEKNKRK